MTFESHSGATHISKNLVRITQCTEILLMELEMTDSYAPDPKICMSLVQLALIYNFSRKVNRNKKRRPISAHSIGPLHTCLHQCFWSNRETLFPFFYTETGNKSSFTSDKIWVLQQKKPKTDWRTWWQKNLWTQLTGTWKKFHWQFCPKQPYPFSYSTLRTKKESKDILHVSRSRHNRLNSN